MKRANIKVVVSILRESSIYPTISHKDKIALISKLIKDYPSLLNAQK